MHFRVTSCGVHTLTYAFRSNVDEQLLAAFRGSREHALTGETVWPRVDGGSTRLRDSVSGAVVGLTRTPRGEHALWVHGRLSAITAQRRRLGRTSTIDRGAEFARTIASSVGVDIPACPTTLSRIDLATDVEFSNQSEADGFLEAMSQVALPRYEMVVHKGVASRMPNSISWRQGNAGIAFRAYDHTANQRRVNPFDRGRVRVRLERQVRRRKPRQIDVASVRVVDFPKLFIGPMESVIRESLVLTGIRDLWRAIESSTSRPSSGAISDCRADSLMGSAVRLLFGGRNVYSSPRAADRRLRDLRAIGVVPSPELTNGSVEIGTVFAAAVAGWQRGGDA